MVEYDGDVVEVAVGIWQSIDPYVNSYEHNIGISMVICVHRHNLLRNIMVLRLHRHMQHVIFMCSITLHVLV